MYAAILGYGTIGSGVAAVLEENAAIIAAKAGMPIEAKYVLDIREFPGDPVEKKLVRDIQVILEDPEIEVVVETMGGLEPAHTFVKSALEAGKSVVTSNKELVAKYGAQLIALAAEKNINFFFEASVGGGIPVIRPMIQCLTADDILEIEGILNGTTNYMLTRMKKEGIPYDEVLKDAQEKGYAERNPAADVEGFDACRKIAILTSLAFGSQVDFEDISTTGITGITSEDVAYAAAMQRDIKLIASSKKTEKGLFAKVSPVMIPADHPLYMVSDVFNAVKVTGNMLGDVMFYGKGAGKYPTASAVVSDVIEAGKNKGRNIRIAWNPDKLQLADLAGFESRFFLRMKGTQDDFGKVQELFADAQLVSDQIAEGEMGCLVGPVSYGELTAKTQKLPGFISCMFVKD